MKTGDRASLKKAFTEQEVEDFAKLSMDYNPIHLDEEFAKGTRFGQKIVHGMLVSSLLSGVMGSRLPGKGAVYLGQSLKFTAPVFIGEEVTAEAEVIHIREDKPIATLRTKITKNNGEVAVEGEAVVMFPRAGG